MTVGMHISPHTPASQCGYKRRAHANAHKFFTEEPRLCAPAVQRKYSNYGDGASVWLTNRIPWKTPLLLTPSSALRNPASPPTPVGMEDRTRLGQRCQPLLFSTMGMDNTGKRTVEEYTCGVTRRGITTNGHLAQHKGWPWANTRVLDLPSGAPPCLTIEGAGGTSTGFTTGNWTEKQ